jgi:POT family proton-dependent oligopeptide transporter
MFFSATLYIERLVSHDMFGYTIPTPAFFAAESLGIIVFGFLLGDVWRRLALKGKDPSHPTKISLSFFIIALTFVCLILSMPTDAQHLGSVWWVIGGLVFFALAELFLGPIGYAATARLAPHHLMGMMMGAWLIAIGLGAKLGSLLAHIAAIPKHIHDDAIIQHIYRHGFYVFIYIAIACGIILLCLRPMLTRWISLGHMRKANNGKTV